MPQTNHNTLRIVLGGGLVIVIVGLFVALKNAIETRADQESLRRRHAAMASQITEIKSGKIDCLVNPDPDFLDELLADSECKANLNTVYLGPDVADPRLGRLRELPKLGSLVFFWTENPEPLLERLHGMESITAISFDRSEVSAKGFVHVASFPNLKSLGVPIHWQPTNSLDALKGHPSLECLTLRQSKCDDALIPLLKSLPRLKNVSIKLRCESEAEAKGLLPALQSNLPECRCSVQMVEGP